MHRLSAAVAAAVLCVGLASPAMASDPPASAAPPSSPSAEHPHCVLTVRPIGETGPAVPLSCFATFAAAVATATDGVVQLPDDATELRRRDLPPTAANVRMTGAVVGTEWEDANFRGWSMVIRGTSAYGCRTGASYLVGGLPSGRNDEISSARTYNGCKSRHFSESNFTGASHLCGCAGMSTMNDRTSSIRFSASG